MCNCFNHSFSHFFSNFFCDFYAQLFVDILFNVFRGSFSCNFSFFRCLAGFFDRFLANFIGDFLSFCFFHINFLGHVCGNFISHLNSDFFSHIFGNTGFIVDRDISHIFGDFFFDFLWAFYFFNHLGFNIIFFSRNVLIGFRNFIHLNCFIGWWRYFFSILFTFFKFNFGFSWSHFFSSNFFNWTFFALISNLINCISLLGDNFFVDNNVIFFILIRSISVRVDNCTFNIIGLFDLIDLFNFVNVIDVNFIDILSIIDFIFFVQLISLNSFSELRVIVNHFSGFFLNCFEAFTKISKFFNLRSYKRFDVYPFEYASVTLK